MQRVTIVRYTAKPGQAEENERLSRAVFDELDAKAPGGMAYSLFRKGDDFVHLFVNFEEDDASVVTELPTFKAFIDGGAERWVAPPEQMRLGMNLVRAYGFDEALAPA